MGRRPCCAKVGLNRGSWSAGEDAILTEYVLAHGEGKWRDLPRRAGLRRCGKSCRLRWLNYLRPDIKRGNITGDEEDLIIRLHNLLGNRWSLIAGRLPGRTDNEIKNHWNTNLSKRLNGVSPNSGGPSATPETARTKPGKVNKKATAECSRRPTTTTTATRTTSSVPQKHSVKVTRTKAVRCTGVYGTEFVLKNAPGSSSKTDPTDNTHLPVPTPTGNDDDDEDGGGGDRDDDDDLLGVFRRIHADVDVDEFMSELASDLLHECRAGDATTANSSDHQIDRGAADFAFPGVDCSLLHFDDGDLEDYGNHWLQPKPDADDGDGFGDLISFLDQ